MNELKDEHVQTLYDLARKYADRQNMDAEQYIDGMFADMLADDGLRLNIPNMVCKLIEYHLQWLRV